MAKKMKSSDRDDDRSDLTLRYERLPYVSTQTTRRRPGRAAGGWCGSGRAFRSGRIG